MSLNGNSVVLTENILTRAHDDVTQCDVKLREEEESKYIVGLCMFPNSLPSPICVQSIPVS